MNDNIGMIVGRDTVFKGDVNLQELIRVDGTFEGDIKTAGKLVIGEPGNVKGNVTAQEATVAGTFNGDLKILGKLELLGTARVYGDIKTSSLVTCDGAILQGTCSMQKNSSPTFSAPSPSHHAGSSNNHSKEKNKENTKS